jgi:uncharacterized protein YdhG (YjbR/CyaY superfamily)
MTIQVVQAYGGRLPDVAPAALPPGVFRLAGWTDRLIVAANCLWVFAVAWRATLVSRSRTRRPAPVAATVRVDAGRGRARELRPLEPLFTHTLAFGRPSKENQAMTATKIDRVDDYLALLPEERRTALERLRAEVHAAAPAATEAISYGMPAFRLGERYFLGFGATKTHCSFYVGRAPLQACAPQLAGYRVWKGTINFTPGSPDPGPPRGGAHTLPSRGVRAGVTTKLACRRAASCRNRSIWNRPGKYAVERRGVVQLRCLETSAPAPSGRVRNRQLASTSRVNGAQDDADERRPL